MNGLWDFIATYWLEFLFGIIAAGILAVGKIMFSLIKKELQRNREDFKAEIQKGQEKFYNKFNCDIKNTYEQTLQNDKELEEQIVHNQEASEQEDIKIENEINILKNGVLSIQGKQFKEECRRVLDEKYVLTIDEYEQLEKDHDVYNSLGGNHTGDSLFKLVQKKVEENFAK